MDPKRKERIIELFEEPYLKKVLIHKMLGRNKYMLEKTIEADAAPDILFKRVMDFLDMQEENGSVYRLQFLSLDNLNTRGERSVHVKQDCPDCNGTGKYVGLFEVTPCKRCRS